MENFDWYAVALVAVSALFALSELLAFIPAVKSNNVFQMIYNIIKWLKENLKK